MKRTQYRYNPSDGRWEFWDNGGWAISKPLRGLGEDAGMRLARALGAIVRFCDTSEQLTRRYS